MRVLLVSPRTPDTFWSFRHALPFISRRAGHPPLGLLTVAAMLPASWELSLVDLDVRELPDADIRRADYVMIGAMILHRESVREIARRSLALGRPVIGGGPLFTSAPESVPEVRHVVSGEAEEVMAELVADMHTGRVRALYRADRWPEMTRSPIPRWDLIDFRDYATMTIQFCRGCPFNCEFCDVIVMNGRVPRTKAPEQVIAELEALRRAGWKRTVFVVDDNFVGNKRRVRELLGAIVAWRARTRARMDFITEASVDLARYPDILERMVAAGFKRVFVGIETPDPSTLRACGKVQNLRRNLLESTRIIQRAGLEVMGGFIVGFDGDERSVFRRQFDFIQRAGIVTAMVGILTALPRTRLHERLAAEGRLLMDSAGNNTEGVCNFVPTLDREELIAGYRALMKRLYEPRAYYRRARVLLRSWRPHGPREHVGAREVRALLLALWQLGVLRDGRRAFWAFLGHTLIRHPRAIGAAVTIAVYGHHFRIVADRL